MRRGCFETVNEMGLDFDLIDVEFFRNQKEIRDALIMKRSGKCLVWCMENRHALKRIGSELEFKLRVQEFIEIARSKQYLEAINFANKYLIGFASHQMAEIQSCMTLLAMKPDTSCTPYKELYSSSRWDDLVVQFEVDFLKLVGLAPLSTLQMYLRAGLSTLKTQQCTESKQRNINCPCCCEFADYSKNLPISRHENSLLVCRLSGKIMDGDNPPMILPNGQVYSWNALKNMAENFDGVVTCPETAQVFKFELARKCFIC